MPALLLHLTVADQIGDDSGNPLLAGLLGASIRSQREAYLLGSILPDLPYHGAFWRQCGRHLMKMRYRDCPWGDLLHARGSADLALGMLGYLHRSVLSESHRRSVIALLAGYLTHYAMDTVIHPEINTLVSERWEREGTEPQALHSDVERWQSLFYHYDLLGEDITGTAYPRSLLAKVAGTGLVWPGLPAELRRPIDAAFTYAHGKMPRPGQLRDWLRGVTEYGALMSSPLGRRIEGFGGDFEESRHRHYQIPGTDLQLAVKSAKDRIVEIFGFTESLLDTEAYGPQARINFYKVVPNLDLDSGR
jgi:hypothetical protein